MTTATGDFAVDFSAASNEDPWANGGFTRLTTSNANNAAKIASNLLAPKTVGYDSLYAYTGSGYTGTTVTSKAEINQVTDLGDLVHLAALDENGHGYGIQVKGTTIAVKRYHAYAIVETLGTANSHTYTSNNVVEFIFTKGSPHSWVVKDAGSTVTIGVASDSQETLGTPRAVIGFEPQNNGSCKIKSLAVDGLTGGGAPVLMGASVM